MNERLLKNFVKLVAALAAVLVLAVSSCSVVQQRERGVKYVFGKVEGEVLPPGLIFHLPFISQIKKYPISPKTFDTTFPVGAAGAITRDMQTVGTSVTVKYAYDEARIMDIATRFGDSVVESAMRSNIIASVKEVVGQYSIYELVEKQPEVTARVAESILARMRDYPITISQTTITNWDWSDDFDRQIKETANRTQQVRQAEQEANIAAADAQKLVKEAEAKKQAIQLEAEAALIKAQNEAKAKQAEADGIAYYNAKVAQNMVVQERQWRHEEQMAYYEKWNGLLVSQYVPLTAAGGIVNLPASPTNGGPGVRKE
ncbi:MAG: prohibitin family protein [Treponema sp.]|nr:prohibitin family protein [Treponema sp.]